MSTFNPAYGSRTPTYGSGPDSPASINTTQPLNGPGMDATIDGHLVVSQTVKMHLRGQPSAITVWQGLCAQCVTASDSLCCSATC